MSYDSIEDLDKEIEAELAAAISEVDEPTEVQDEVVEESTEAVTPADNNEEEIVGEEPVEDNVEHTEQAVEDFSGEDVEEIVLPAGSSFEPLHVSINGLDVTLNSMSEVQSYLNKVNSMPKKAPSEAEQILTQSGLSIEDISLLVDAKRGDAAAIKALASASNISLLDVEDAGEYQRKFAPQFMTDVDVVANEILSDSKWASDFKHVSSQIPDSMVSAIGSDAESLRHFGLHVKEGIAQKILPEAMKIHALTGKDPMEAYLEVGNKMFSQPQPAPKPAKPTAKPSSRRQDRLARMAAGQGNNRSTGQGGYSEDDIWNMSEEEIMNLDLSTL
jgi:hypothetical protein